MEDKQNYLKHISTGDVLIREGDPASCAYLVEHGKLEVSTRREGKRIALARVGANGMVGEMALVTGREHSATVIALEPTRLIRITQEYLDDRLDAADPLLRHILEVVMTRFRDVLRTVNGEQRDSQTEAYLTETASRHHGDRARAISSLQLQHQVEQALDAGDLELHYQPIIRLSDRSVAGFEALIRWRKPGRDLLVPPNQFIPVIERTPLIMRLGHWIFETACADLRLFREVGQVVQPNAAPMTMSVNLAARQFNDPELFTHISHALDANDIAADQFCIEITESMVLQNWDVVLEVLQRARRMGIKIAIDDFGTGHSSLAYLHRFPVDVLKLDRAFIRDMGSNAHSRAIVGAIARLARELDMTAIAEGVENREQARVLRAMGVDNVQGFYFGRPMALNHALDLLQEQAAQPVSIDSPNGRGAAGSRGEVRHAS